VYESPVSAGKKASILNFLLTIGLAIVGFIYLMLAAYSQDPLWFWPKFNALPNQITVRCYGSELKLDGTSAQAQAIALLVNEQISGDKRFDPLNLTAPTYEYYQSDPGVATIELTYAAPVRIHLPNKYFTNITSLLIPLDGRYANSAIVFGLINGKPAGGSIHVTTNQPIIDYLAGSSLCSKF
jgi:hypothetical protein